MFGRHDSEYQKFKGPSVVEVLAAMGLTTAALGKHDRKNIEAGRCPRSTIHIGSWITPPGIEITTTHRQSKDDKGKWFDLIEVERVQLTAGYNQPKSWFKPGKKGWEDGAREKFERIKEAAEAHAKYEADVARSRKERAQKEGERSAAFMEALAGFEPKALGRYNVERSINGTLDVSLTKIDPALAAELVQKIDALVQSAEAHSST